MALIFEVRKCILFINCYFLIWFIFNCEEIVCINILIPCNLHGMFMIQYLSWWGKHCILYYVIFSLPNQSNPFEICNCNDFGHPWWIERQKCSTPTLLHGEAENINVKILNCYENKGRHATYCRNIDIFSALFKWALSHYSNISLVNICHRL